MVIIRYHAIQLFSVLAGTMLLLSLAGCIGSSPQLHYYGGENERQEGIRELDAEFDAFFIGKSRDDVIVIYGPPSHSLTLSDGTKLMQYNVKRTFITNKNRRHYSNCELRLWLNNNKIRQVDYLGYEPLCAKFAHNAKRNIIDDER